MTIKNPPCPLCQTNQTHPFAQAHQREYFECHLCRLIYMHPNQHLSPKEERKRYETHNNNPTDPNYRNFLNRLATPLMEHLVKGAEGLDYGSGPGPTLSIMLKEHGFSMAIYDPFFAPDPKSLTRTYDFITCTETVEHFFNPHKEFQQFNHLLRPGGWLGIMTEIRQEDCPFEQWYYVRDNTHVCFYNKDTMAYLATHFKWILQSPHKNVFLFQKPVHP